MRRRAARLALCALAATLCGAGAARADSVRPLPWPFEHMVTVASDVDLQPPWYGLALHRRMNRDLGLRIADSFWVSATTGAAGSSALFAGPARRNLAPTGVDGHPAFWLLLRAFHRGDLDHLHGWQDDGLPRYRHALEAPARIGADGLRVELPRVAFHDRLWRAGGAQPASLRLVFDAPPPADLAIRLVGGDGVETPVPATAIRRGAALQPAPAAEHLVEIVMADEAAEGLLAFRGQPTAILLTAPDSPAALRRVEWDGFSRSTVLMQAPALEAFNIRPTLSSAHGGFTRAQNLGRGEAYALTPFGEADLVRHAQWTARAQGDDPASHAYHVDILARLGVASIADIPPVDFPYTVGPPPPLAPLAGAPFWAMHKTWGLALRPPATPEAIAAELARRDPVAAAAGVGRLLCVHDALCLRSEQGRTLGYQIATSLAHVGAGKGRVTHAWYQHFGTALSAPGAALSLERPFADEVDAQLWRLSDHVYDWTGTVSPRARVWAPAPAVWQTYRIALAHLAGAVSVAPDSTVDIRTVFDPVLGRPWPAPGAPLRELHGLTIYAPDPDNAKVRLDGVELTSFTRNPHDFSGRRSVTLVNDAFPQTLLGPVPAEDAGVVALRAARRDPAAGGAAIVAAGADPSLTLAPGDAALWNVSHFRLDAEAGGAGRMWIVLTMQSGARVALLEDGAVAPTHDAALALPPRRADGGARLVALSAIRPRAPLAVGADPPLPLGRIVRIEFGLSGAAAGDRLTIRDFAGLQALAHALAPDGSVALAGRLRDRAGRPAAGRAVTIGLADGASRRVVSDAQGYYAFFALARGQIVSVSADMADGACAPARGRRLWLARDEVEIDIDAWACR